MTFLAILKFRTRLLSCVTQSTPKILINKFCKLVMRVWTPITQNCIFVTPSILLPTMNSQIATSCFKSMI